MMRSMFSGVSSLRAHQLRMDVIGNNIANVNTVGFKSSSVTFAEAFSQTLQGASSSGESRGGTNPKQVGLGTSVSSIAVNHTRGSIQRTDVATDLMIDGNGFFMVTNDANAQNKFYTRAGNFAMDSLGYLVTTDGLRVLDKDFKPVQVNMSESIKAQVSNTLTINGNINTSATEYNVTADIYDSLGAVHRINAKFGDNLTTTAPKVADAQDPIKIANPAVTNLNYSYRPFTLTTSAGANMAFQADGTTPIPNIFAKFNENGEFVDLVTLADPADPGSAETVVNGVIKMSVPGASDISIPLNRSIGFANGDQTGARIFTQFSKDSDAKGVQIGGNSAGTIDTFNISSKGEVVGIFTNGERKVLTTLGLVDFDNPPGLMKIGGNLFQDTPNSGTPKYGSPGTGSFGAIAAGSLEMSNVDIAAQFTDMITTQRGFQANSRVITTSDEILQELVNLKR